MAEDIIAGNVSITRPHSNTSFDEEEAVQILEDVQTSVGDGAGARQSVVDDGTLPGDEVAKATAIGKQLITMLFDAKLKVPAGACEQILKLFLDMQCRVAALSTERSGTNGRADELRVQMANLQAAALALMNESIGRRTFADVVQAPGGYGPEEIECNPLRWGRHFEELLRLRRRRALLTAPCF